MTKLRNCKNIFIELDEAFRASGFIGDTSIPRLVWLASHTRAFEELVSLVILGPSGCGKSYALKTGLKFVPDSAYELLHGMSEKALIYSTDLNLQNRHLVIQEAAGMAEGNGRTFLRQLLSEGEAKYRTVDSVGGELSSKELHIQGPTGLMMTTTANQLHPEDASRVLCVNVKEDGEHIRNVLLAQAVGSQGMISHDEIQRWKDFSVAATATKLEVSIPYASKLARSLPTSHHRIQRDFKQVLSLIRACALLHRCSRERDNEGQIVANIDDYRIVYSLVANLISEGLETSISDSVREVVNAVEDMRKPAKWKHQHKLTQKRIADHIARDRSSVSRNISKAIELGYLRNDNPGQGRDADIDLGEHKMPENQKVLPLPEALREVEAIM